MNDDKTAAGTVTTVISGNVRANGEDGMINVGLSDKKSSLTGVAFSQNNGVINMYLNNGAAWNNQVWGKTDGGFDGSHVAKLAGGATEAVTSVTDGATEAVTSVTEQAQTAVEEITNNLGL